MSAIESQKSFLDINCSVTKRKWLERLHPEISNIADAISQNHELPKMVARVMAARGVTPETTQKFLNPTLRDAMPDPSILNDMDIAAERIFKAIKNNERVAIVTDYDVDGACSAALISKYFSCFKIKHEIYVPHRIFEGYGPNPDIITELVKKKSSLIITTDCGTTSFKALEKAKELGIDVVVLDHHQACEKLPLACALVNPNQDNDLSGLGYLCAAGIVFMVLVAINRILRKYSHSNEIKNNIPDLMQWLDLVALATVCDVVPLVNLNRAFVTQGMRILCHRRNIGIKVLVETANVQGPLSLYHLGFVLGPRINAGGRIGDAQLGVQLLTSDNELSACKIAKKLENLNKQRQEMEALMLVEAQAQVDTETKNELYPRILITQSNSWHPGITGLLAARLKEQYNCPAFAIAFNEFGVGTGSGRSIPEIDMGKYVRAAVEKGLLIKGGGHAMAAGFSVKRNKLDLLHDFFEQHLINDSLKSKITTTIKVDGVITANAATLDFLQALEKAGPYGAGYPVPVFVLPAHKIKYASLVGKNHVRVTLLSSEGKYLQAIAFRVADQPLGDLLLKDRENHIHFAGTLMINYWNGVKSVQFRILDAALCIN